MAKEKYLSHFTVDRHQKIVRQGEIEMVSLLTLPQVPTVSNSNTNPSIKSYID
jgi:AMMECR1 domain-containing protein